MAFQPGRPPMPPAGGAAPPPAAPSMGAPPMRAPMAPPPAGSVFHNEVLKRLRTMPPQDKQVLIRGITPALAMVLKTLLPEIADIIDKVVPPSAPPMMDRPDVMRPGPDSVPPPGPPATKLGQF